MTELSSVLCTDMNSNAYTDIKNYVCEKEMKAISQWNGEVVMVIVLWSPAAALLVITKMTPS